MTDALDDYKRKRDFDATPEPAGQPRRARGKRKAPAGALQYCIQKHDATRLHYDFRLELEGTLKSWAVPKGPSLDPQAKRLAIHVEDHPLDYADFEGHIPEGHYGAGDVIVWDRGIWIPQDDPVASYAKGKLKFELRGEKLSGSWNLVRTHMPGKQEQWFLIKHRDDAARPESELDITEARPESVLSERTLLPKEKGKKAPRQPRKAAASKPPRGKALAGSVAASLPETIKPQLATLVDGPPAGDWRYEVKFDGYRLLARIKDGEVQLLTRNGKDWTSKLPRQAKALAGLALDSAWLDGEAIVTDEDGAPDFQALQNAFETARSEAILYYVFDLLYLDGKDLRGVPLEQRRAVLEKLLKNNEDSPLRYSADLAEDPESLLESACRMKLEGLIGKRAGSLYESRRSPDWIKLKCKQRQEFVIVGHTEPKGSRSHFGALLLALHDEDSGELHYAGKVGTGFDQASLARVQARMKPLEVKKSPLAHPPTGSEVRGVHWLKPELLAEVAFAEMTREGLVRHAVFHGLRSDKPASAITREKASHMEPTKPGGKARPAKQPARETAGKFRITHPERIIDASIGATKLELAGYYADIAEWLLPELRDRPVALVRAPDGIAGEHFFQKSGENLGIDALEVLEKSRAGQPAMIINSIEALVGAVQMGTVELHTWNATSTDLAHPDRFILDLDPDPALPWKAMVEATQLVLTVLDELGLRAFLKTSGGKGMHLVVPLKPKEDWDQVKAFSHAIATHMARHLPQRFSAKSGPKNRVGKIFIDYLRNGLGATTVAAYSARAREGLPVSVPVFFEELGGLKGAHDWTIRNLRKRLDEAGESPWADFEANRQTITKAMRKRLGMV
ncbi:DNA ligase D [Pseudomonas sp. BN414]|uniref:DNA ligase D n=1 Tax=Pseudomonas sp. BN414 TaxID=2567888 RepID=UPI00245840AC|nr:DNA ligase D [Pseudomonas sp. BN414]MDH4567545.1 DNA ligase D [Pseudomonas sp. BN414]